MKRIKLKVFEPILLPRLPAPIEHVSLKKKVRLKHQKINPPHWETISQNLPVWTVHKNGPTPITNNSAKWMSPSLYAKDAERCPCSHNFPPFRLRISSSISPLSFVFDDMCQRHFDVLTRKVCRLSSPIAEGGAESVHSDFNIHAL